MGGKKNQEVAAKMRWRNVAKEEEKKNGGGGGVELKHDPRAFSHHKDWCKVR